MSYQDYGDIDKHNQIRCCPGTDSGVEDGRVKGGTDDPTVNPSR